MISEAVKEQKTPHEKNSPEKTRSHPVYQAEREDEQGLGMTPGELHFITLYSNNSTPTDKLDVVLCLSKCYVGSLQTWL